jgi:hypothetical protein
MWGHVTSEKFNYLVNTAIINAAIDYESKLARNIATVVASIRLNANMPASSGDQNAVFSNFMAAVSNNSAGGRESALDAASSARKLQSLNLEKRVLSTLELLDYQDVSKRLLTYSNYNVKKYEPAHDEGSEPMVAFKCFKCEFQTIDLCELRLHRLEEHALIGGDHSHHHRHSTDMAVGDN